MLLDQIVLAAPLLIPVKEGFWILNPEGEKLDDAAHEES